MAQTFYIVDGLLWYGIPIKLETISTVPFCKQIHGPTCKYCLCARRIESHPHIGIPLDLGTISSQDIPGFLGIYHNSYSNLCSHEYMAIILLQAWSSMQFWDGIYIPLHCFQNPAICKLAAIRAQKGSAAEPLPTNLCEGDDPHLLFHKELCGSSNFMMPKSNKNEQTLHFWLTR